ncbi:MAG: hypothetical protein LBM12_02055 [Candidatus Nomurabacteria bacterium]|jgi:hypothetical protein|nr:hypothetical protein [Candidatus Nomurabacteria bacterium]
MKKDRTRFIAVATVSTATLIIAIVIWNVTSKNLYPSSDTILDNNLLPKYTTMADGEDVDILLFYKGLGFSVKQTFWRDFYSATLPSGWSISRIASGQTSTPEDPLRFRAWSNGKTVPRDTFIVYNEHGYAVCGFGVTAGKRAEFPVRLVMLPRLYSFTQVEVDGTIIGDPKEAITFSVEPGTTFKIREVFIDAKLDTICDTSEWTTVISSPNESERLLPPASPIMPEDINPEEADHEHNDILMYLWLASYDDMLSDFSIPT